MNALHVVPDDLSAEPLALANAIELVAKQGGHPIPTAAGSEEVEIILYVSELITIINALHAAHAKKTETK